MQMHPAEIAREIQAYPFFLSFDESLLLQVSTMVREVSFDAGKTILAPGETNNTLYFMRQGTVQIRVDEEVVNELTSAGEVLGEMSALSGKPVSAQIVAKTAVKCFSIKSEDFAHVHPHQKDRFQFLLYRIYSGVLTERLAKTNEKAKLYEITARLLDRAKKDLELTTNAQMGLLRSSVNVSEKSVLILEPSKKQQNIIRSAVASTGVQLSLATTIEEAKEFAAGKKYDVVFCEQSCIPFIDWLKSIQFHGQIVLLQPNDFNYDLLMHEANVPFVISQDPEDRSGTVRNLLTSMTKILNKDYFGLEKYLAWGTEVKKKKVTSSRERELYREDLLKVFKSFGVRTSLLDRVQVAVEEMLMNSIYDAPVDKEGKALYNHLPRSTAVDLKSEEFSELCYGCDGNMLAVSVRDPFGSLSREIIAKYFRRGYSGPDASDDPHGPEKGGAGRGLHQILESCDVTIFNIRAGQSTEVIALFDIEAANKKVDSRPKFHFFFIPR